MTYLGYELTDGVAYLRLQRPDKVNALNAVLLGELAEALARAEAEGARAALLSGEGRGFCSGQDLSDPSALGEDFPPDLGKVLDRAYHPTLKAMKAAPFPLIAAVHGVAAGAGVSLALACDLVVAGEATRWSIGFTRIGLVPDAGLTHILPRLVGQQQAARLLMLGEDLAGQVALDMGLVAKLVPEDEVFAQASDLAKAMAQGPTQAYRAVKEALAGTWQNGFEAQLALEANLQTQMGRTRDFAEGVGAFAGKRAPRFTGK